MAEKKEVLRIDFASGAGLVLAAGGIVGGLLLEGGKIQDVSQITAAIIVFGGTLGAVMLNTPAEILWRAIKSVSRIFVEKAVPREKTLEELIGYATTARKMGLVSLESEVPGIADPFMAKALNLTIDGTDLQEMKRTMEVEILLEERRSEAEAKVYESAGGYAPTIGIIGAVMGLIQVMKNLANIDEVGHGIAVAFVATVYGVASANLFYLPAAGKIRARAAAEVERKEMVLEGVAAIVEGLNPKIIRGRLESYLATRPAAEKRQGQAIRAAKSAAA